MSETRYPLCWPEGWKRTSQAYRTTGRFGRNEALYDSQSIPRGYRLKSLSIDDSLRRVYKELEMLGAKGEVICSTNLPVKLDGSPYGNRGEPADPGAAIYWTDKIGRKKCIAVDRYTRVADNIAAIAATLESMRAIQRHGGAEILERTFLGFSQLPERAGVDWRKVLEFGEQPVTRELVEIRFRKLVGRVHPDTVGGDHDRMVELNAARAAAILELNL